MLSGVRNLTRKFIYHSAIRYYFICDLYAYLKSLKKWCKDDETINWSPGFEYLSKNFK